VELVLTASSMGTRVFGFSQVLAGRRGRNYGDKGVKPGRV